MDKKTSILYAAATNYKRKSISNVLPNVIGQVLKPMGKYQWAVLIVMAFNAGIVSLNHALPSFHTFIPEFRCQDDANGNFSRICEVKDNTCSSGFEFSDEDHTIVDEFSLVCSRLFLGPLANSVYYGGVTIGALLCGIMSDRWGRRKILWLCLYAQGILGIVVAYAPNLYWFMAIRAFQGFFVQGLQGVAFTLMLEYSPPHYRTIAGVIWEIGWATGLMFLGGVSYFVRDWHMLQLYLTIPTAFTLLYAWAFPESMFWLYSANLRREAYEQCKITAKYNGNYEIIEDSKTIIEATFKGPEDDEWLEPLKVNANFMDIFQSKALRKHLFISVSLWYSIMLTYYSPLYFLPSLQGDRHANYFLLSGIEFIAYGIVFFLLEKLGRRKTMTFFQYIGGFCCLLLSMIFVYVPDHQYQKDLITIIISLMIKLAATALTTCIFIYTTELFPTTVRGAAFGICGFSSRVGTLTAPFLMALLYTVPLVPMTVVGTIIIITGTMTMFLPETLNRYAPNTIAEANELWNRE